MKDRRHQDEVARIVAGSVPQALLGAVTPDLRCVQGLIDGDWIRLRAVYASVPTAVDIEDMSVVETEVMAAFDSSVSVQMEVCQTPKCMPCRVEGWTTYYQRKE